MREEKPKPPRTVLVVYNHLGQATRLLWSGSIRFWRKTGLRVARYALMPVKKRAR